MSVEAIKVNELLEEAAAFCQKKSDEIRAYVNDEIRDPGFLMDGESAATDLDGIADQIRTLTLDEEGY